MLCYCVCGRISSICVACACCMSSLLHSGMSHASTYYAVAHRECEWRTQGGCCCSLGLNLVEFVRLSCVAFNPLIPNGHSTHPAIPLACPMSLCIQVEGWLIPQAGGHSIEAHTTHILYNPTTHTVAQSPVLPCVRYYN